MFKKEHVVFKTRLGIYRHRLSRAKIFTLPTAVGGAVGTGAFRTAEYQTCQILHMQTSSGQNMPNICGPNAGFTLVILVN